VVTNAQLTTTQLKKIANMAHDGLARAVRPVHTQFDGDTMFAMSMPNSAQSGESVAESLLNTVGIAAAKVMELAIIDAVKSAESLGGVIASCDWAKK
jgi:L-aminopeptidase/D-esterase-like protein